MVVKMRAARVVSRGPLSTRAPDIQMASSTKPTVNCVFFPMAGLKGEDAAASQTSRSGLDMGVGVQLTCVCVWLS
jgi:hypothetical protein